MKNVFILITIGSLASLHAMEDEVNFRIEGNKLNLEVPEEWGCLEEQGEWELLIDPNVSKNEIMQQKIITEKAERALWNNPWFCSKIPGLNQYKASIAMVGVVRIKKEECEFKVPHWFCLEFNLDQEDKRLLMFSLATIKDDKVMIIPWSADDLKKGPQGNYYRNDQSNLSFIFNKANMVLRK